MLHSFVNKLEPGCGFGEVAMVALGRRSATVRCEGICELSVLARASLERLMQEFPSDVVNVKQYAQTKMAQMKVMNRMTFLLAKDRLSPETRGYMVICRMVRCWKYRRWIKKVGANRRAHVSQNSPETMSSYTQLLLMAGADGSIAPEEGVQLEIFRKRNEISIATRNSILTRDLGWSAETIAALDHRTSERGDSMSLTEALASYTQLLLMAGADGSITPERGAQLESYRQKHDISITTRNTILTRDLVWSNQAIDALDHCRIAADELVPEVETKTSRSNTPPSSRGVGKGETISTQQHTHSSASKIAVDSAELYAHMELLNEEAVQESRQGLAEMKIQMGELEAKLDAVLTAVTVLAGGVAAAHHPTPGSSAQEPVVPHLALSLQPRSPTGQRQQPSSPSR
jgi:CRP-like cAMP-binding protein